jgi:hypothetical protein
MNKPWVIHPFLFALYPIAFVYSRNFEHSSLAQAQTSLLIMMGLTVILFLFCTVILRDAMRGGLVLSWLLIMTFSYTPVLEVIARMPLVSLALEREFVPLIGWILLTLTGLALVLRIKTELPNITRILNVVAIALLSFPLARIGWGELRRIVLRDGSDAIQITVDQTRSLEPDTLPDIYYIILDGYAREDVLAELYGFDNSEFLEYLEQKGFYIAHQSHANYAQTALSLPSSLNFTYLDDLAAHLGSDSDDRRQLARMIEDSSLVHFLRQYGYTIVTSRSGYWVTELETADSYYGPRRTLNELEIGLLLNTPLPRLFSGSKQSSIDPYSQHRDTVLNTLTMLADSAQISSPHFVFAHIICPHPPFIFDSTGQQTRPSRDFTLVDGSKFYEHGGTQSEYQEGYVAQLTFLNDRIKQVLDGLLIQTPHPKIVILQSDHGPGMLLDWDDPDNTNLGERLSILNAYLLPDEATQELYDSITPVNTFRLILKHYFGADLQLLEDKSYFSSVDNPYKFIRVTDKLRNAQGNYMSP